MEFRALGMVLALACGPAGEAFAWGATGHEWISGIAIEKLPDDVPAFVRSPEAVSEIAVMGRELDRSKGAGETHDKERDPGHYVDLTDDGKVMGIVPLDKLPVTREAYDTWLRARGSTQYKAGYLPYSMVDGWQQLVKDFAYWRAAVKGAETAATPDERAWFEADRRLREKLTLRDIGIWSHYAGDASQPLHVSVHFNGWGDYPNPAGYTNSKKLHAYFEGEFVRRYLTRDVVAAEVKPWEDCRCSIQDKTRILLEMSLGNVTALYDVKKVGGFKGGDPRGVEFATARLALGAQFARDTYNSRNATGETLPGRRDNLRSALPTRRERHSCSRSQATTTSWRTKQRYATRLKSRTWSGIPRAFFWIEPHQRAFGRSPKSEEQARRPWPLPAPAAAPTRV